MTVDSQTQAVLDQGAASGAPPLCELAIPEARAALKGMSQAMDIERLEVDRWAEECVETATGKFSLRVYWPASSDEPLPLLLLFHGGGFSLGDLDTHDHMARYYCKHAGMIVVSVDYRLAPEHKFPVGVEDCYAATVWAVNNAQRLGADPERVAVTGDSAGGNLSAAVCQLAKIRKSPAIAYQVLVYPCVTFEPQASFASRERYGQGEFFLSQRDIERIADDYFEDPADYLDHRASPILNEDLTDLPPALVITAGHDPLCDEGMDYACRLSDAGVAAEYHCFEHTIHGFMSFGGAIDAGRDGLALVTSRLASVFHTGGLDKDNANAN